MCALARYFENAGIATSVIALVRMHAEAIRPPRALFVPFELGRPLGEPNAPTAQRDVLLSALRLFEEPGTPPVLVDFPDQHRVQDRSHWDPIFDLPGDTDRPVSAAALAREAEALRPHYECAKAGRGRTTFGNSELDPDAVVALIGRLLENALPAGEVISGRQVRFAIDDLKTLYSETATWTDAPPSSWQIADWFWRRTLAGQAIIALRSAVMAGRHDGISAVSSRFFIPGAWLDELGL